LKLTSWDPKKLRADIEAARSEDPEKFKDAHAAATAPPPKEEVQPEPPGIRSRDREESFGEPNEKDLDQMQGQSVPVQPEAHGAPVNTGASADVNDMRAKLAQNLGVEDAAVVRPGQDLAPPPAPESTPAPAPAPIPVAVEPAPAPASEPKSILKKSEPPAPVPAESPKVTFARCLYEFLPENDDELFLKKGEIFVITGYEDEEWAEGQTKDGRVGLFPLNYVEDLPESEVQKLEFRNKTEQVTTQRGPGTMDVFNQDKQERYWDLVDKVSDGRGTTADNIEVEELGKQLQIPIEQKAETSSGGGSGGGLGGGPPGGGMPMNLMAQINARRID